MSLSQAIFEAEFDGVARLPKLPRKVRGDFTLFDGSSGAGWCLCYDFNDTPATVTVRVSTSAGTMAALEADPTILYLADAGSSVKDIALTAAMAGEVRTWLRDRGYSAAKHSAALVKVNGARKRRDLVRYVVEDLHGKSLVDVERGHIGG